MKNNTNQTEFIWGAQYYRAPTPDRKFWEGDLANMKKLGFTDIKYWVQWRWSSRKEGEFYFDDLDMLMDLAEKYGLRVTLNIICDVTPSWFLTKYPECKQVLPNGTKVQPYVSVCRQIGGMPGPCYNHDKGIEEREKFIKAAAERYASHPAMYMWDVWNEPEQCHKYRRPTNDTVTCYCPACREKFIARMREKYVSIEHLNEIWGRCYTSFDEVELPQNAEVFGDFIDFREFHLDTMTAEAKMRIEVVKEFDKVHPVYLHVVPNTSSIFNSVTGVDDYALADMCDVFAATNFPTPIWSVLTLSAANGKPAYNVECHMGTGSTAMHPKVIEYDDVVRDFVPQIGLGIRGFMFWQYHAELLGLEAPAWGVTNPDGSIGSIGKSCESFFEKLKPYIKEIENAKPTEAQVAIWKGRKNELLSYGINGNLSEFAESIQGYVNFCYDNNYPCKVIDDSLLCTDGLDGVRLLIMPVCYELDARVAEAVDRFVLNGGVVLCEAHLGGYNADTNRHSEICPAFGLAEKWAIREIETTSSFRLKYKSVSSGGTSETLNDDVKKAIEAYGLDGGKYFAITTDNGIVMGADRFAELSFKNGRAIGKFGDKVCMAELEYEKGKIVYCGTNLASASKVDKIGFYAFCESVCNTAGLNKTLGGLVSGVHVDRVGEYLLCVKNTTDKQVKLPLDGKSIFYPERGINIAPNSADMIRIEK